MGLIYFKFYPNDIFVIGEARRFKFRLLVDTEEYECMHDILLPRFWEISDNISLTVQDRDTMCWTRLVISSAYERT